MTRTICVALLTLTAAGAAHAGLQLGERPIARTEVIATVKKQFAVMDVNRDGGISPDEFTAYREKQAAMPDQGRGLTRIGRSWFERSDVDGNSRVTPDEAQGRPLELFDMADANRDGVASIAEQSVAALFVK
ncbi:hypothetical protein [Sphingomonas sp. SRS2]|uniref:hypothetical protein n=1 Tax=Sphingomonas sp. SRS2 TaxID=133190 RepID=UPI00061844F7|nr:hypothetical protein [Sphingomonas sp. SRS2]KKC24747.1 hypothetical protein WP12_17700 [Sphingomonas sp. SRS2]